jgi:membrane protein implicated in regulation of membrane protease activity
MMDLIALIEQWAWVGWLVLIVIFLVIEVLSLDLTFLMIALGSTAGLIADFAGLPVWLQVIIAAVAAAVLLFFLRPPLLRRLHRGEDATPSNVDALIGLRGQVLATVSTLGGQVKLSNGDIWTARTAAGEIPPGASVSVSRIDGATAIVSAHEEELSA